MPAWSHPLRALRALLATALVGLSAPVLATPIWHRVDPLRPSVPTLGGKGVGELARPETPSAAARAVVGDYNSAFRIDGPGRTIDLRYDLGFLPPRPRGLLHGHAYDPPPIHTAGTIAAQTPSYDPPRHLAIDRWRSVSLHQQHASAYEPTRIQRFQGLWTDPLTGLAYARARWYDARNATWLSEDPLGAVDSPNLYAYVGWQPQMYTDPLGLQGVVVGPNGMRNQSASEFYQMLLEMGYKVPEAQRIAIEAGYGAEMGAGNISAITPAIVASGKMIERVTVTAGVLGVTGGAGLAAAGALGTGVVLSSTIVGGTTGFGSQLASDINNRQFIGTWAYTKLTGIGAGLGLGFGGLAKGISFGTWYHTLSILRSRCGPGVATIAHPVLWW